jgi:hypothetical protein
LSEREEGGRVAPEGDAADGAEDVEVDEVERVLAWVVGLLDGWRGVLCASSSSFFWCGEWDGGKRGAGEVLAGFGRRAGVELFFDETREEPLAFLSPA